MYKKEEIMKEREKHLLASTRLYRYFFNYKETVHVFFDSKNNEENNVLSGVIIGGSKNTLLLQNKDGELFLIYMGAVLYIEFENTKNLSPQDIYDNSKDNTRQSSYIDEGRVYTQIIRTATLVNCHFNDGMVIATRLSSVGKYDFVSCLEDEVTILIFQKNKVQYLELGVINIDDF